MDDARYSRGNVGFLRMAYHEAGHTLVTHRLGIAVELVIVAQLDGMLAAFDDGSGLGSQSKPVASEFCSAPWTYQSLIKRACEVAERRYLVKEGIDSSPVLAQYTWQDDFDHIQTYFKDNAGKGDPELDPAAQADFETFEKSLAIRLEQWFDEPEMMGKMAALIGEIERVRETDEEDRSRSVLGMARLSELLAGLARISTPLELWPAG